MKPTFVRIVINPVAGSEEEVRQALLTRLNAYEGDGARPISIRWLRARFDLEVIVAVYDFTSLDDLIIDTIRSVAGVAATTSQVLFDGFLFPGGIMMAENAREQGLFYAEATVEIQIEPGKERSVFAALYDLPEADDLHKIMLFKSFSTPTTDVVLQIGSNSRETLENYVQVFVRPIDGVEDTYTSQTFGWALLMPLEALMTLQAQFSPV